MTEKLKPQCASCRRSKSDFVCEACQKPLCRGCEVFLEESTFSFLEAVPEILKHTHYCPYCHAEHIEPAVESYQATMELAKNVYVFFVSQRKALPILKRARFKIAVKECMDRDEIILRLAFKAVEHGFNAVIEADVICKKVRDEGYEKSVWSAVAIPANVDVERLMRHDSQD